MKTPEGGEVWYNSNSNKYYFVVDELLIQVDPNITINSFEDLISKENIFEKIFDLSTIFNGEDGWNFINKNWRKFLRER